MLQTFTVVWQKCMSNTLLLWQVKRDSRDRRVLSEINTTDFLDTSLYPPLPTNASLEMLSDPQVRFAARAPRNHPLRVSHSTRVG